uniref:Protein kinase domain-containing protein n=1 Tax=viral metagenome TaxID=1070528 RepID=A0A6C0E6Q2_9ZZZZ
MSTKRKLSDSDGNPRKKFKKLNSGSYGNVFSDGSMAYKVSKYDLESSDGINPEILNEIIYLKKFRDNKYLLSLKSVEITLENAKNSKGNTNNVNNINIKILIPLAVSDLSVFIREKTLIERGKYWDLLMSNILSGLEYLQRNKICHLDIKPDNILYFGDHFKLNDFNLTISTNNLRNGMTHPAMTVLYRSPEVIIHNDYHNILNNWVIEIKSDMWSLGCTLYEYITSNHLLDVRHNSQLLKLLYYKLTDLQTERLPYDNYLFLQNLNNKIYHSLPLIGLEFYMEKASINKYQQWYNTICNMLRVDPSQRPTAIEIINEYGYNNNIEMVDNLNINYWNNFDYYKNLLDKIGYTNKYTFFDKIQFMTKLKYDYSNSYDRKYLWNSLWIRYKHMNNYSEDIFLEIFEVMDRYLLTLIKSKPDVHISSYNELFDVVNRLINKLRRPEIADSIVCLPKNKSNRMELDIIRVLDYDFGISSVKIDNMNVNIGQILE